MIASKKIGTMPGMMIPFDPQIVAPPDIGMQIGARRAPALAIFLSQLIDAEAFLILAVEIVAQGHLRLARGLEKNAVIGVIGARARHIERPVRPVETVAKILVALRLPEPGQDLRLLELRHLLFP